MPGKCTRFPQLREIGARHSGCVLFRPIPDRSDNLEWGGNTYNYFSIFASVSSRIACRNVVRYSEKLTRSSA